VIAGRDEVYGKHPHSDVSENKTVLFQQSMKGSMKVIPLHFFSRNYNNNCNEIYIYCGYIFFQVIIYA